MTWSPGARLQDAHHTNPTSGKRLSCRQWQGGGINCDVLGPENIKNLYFFFKHLYFYVFFLETSEPLCFSFFGDFRAPEVHFFFSNIKHTI